MFKSSLKKCAVAVVGSVFANLCAMDQTPLSQRSNSSTQLNQKQYKKLDIEQIIKNGEYITWNLEKLNLQEIAKFGENFMIRNQIVLGMEFLRVSAERGGSREKVIYERSLSLLNLNAGQGAIAVYLEAAKQGMSEGQYNLAFALEEQGDLEGAEKWYRAAASQGLPRAQNNLAMLLEKRGMIDEARILFITAALTGEPHIIMNLGEFYFCQNNFNDAKKCYEAIKDLIPEAQLRLTQISEILNPGIASCQLKL
jgi:tetratricopeptide (TPR) repeat protein